MKHLCGDCDRDITPKHPREIPSLCHYCGGTNLHCYNVQEQEELETTYKQETIDKETLETLSNYTGTYFNFLGGANGHTDRGSESVEGRS